jgi:DNA repair protein RecN (Recombination protein N)
MPVAMLSEVGEQVVAGARPVRPAAPAAPGRAARRAGPVRRGPSTRKLLETYREAFTGRWRAVVDDLADRRRNARERSQEADLLKLGLDEISRADPQPG